MDIPVGYKYLRYCKFGIIRGGVFWKYPLSRIYLKSMRIFIYLCGDIYIWYL